MAMIIVIWDDHMSRSSKVISSKNPRWGVAWIFRNEIDGTGIFPNIFLAPSIWNQSALRWRLPVLPGPRTRQGMEVAKATRANPLLSPNPSSMRLAMLEAKMVRQFIRHWLRFNQTNRTGVPTRIGLSSSNINQNTVKLSFSFLKVWFGSFWTVKTGTWRASTTANWFFWRRVPQIRGFYDSKRPLSGFDVHGFDQPVKSICDWTHYHSSWISLNYVLGLPGLNPGVEFERFPKTTTSVEHVGIFLASSVEMGKSEQYGNCSIYTVQQPFC